MPGFSKFITFYMKLLNLLVILFLFNACANLPGGDARKNPPDPRERVKNNLEQGKGFRLSNAIKNRGGGDFEFASSNELWRATLDVIDYEKKY